MYDHFLLHLCIFCTFGARFAYEITQPGFDRSCRCLRSASWSNGSAPSEGAVDVGNWWAPPNENQDFCAKKREKTLLDVVFGLIWMFQTKILIKFAAARLPENFIQILLQPPPPTVTGACITFIGLLCFIWNLARGSAVPGIPRCAGWDREPREPRLPTPIPLGDIELASDTAGAESMPTE